MIGFKSIFLLAIGLSIWGNMAVSPVIPENGAIAQTAPANNRRDFDRLMKAGYTASKAKQYREALENFKAALALQPNDRYARRAILNMESALGIPRSQSALNTNTNNNSLPLPLLAGSVLLTLALAGAFISFLSGSKPDRKVIKNKTAPKVKTTVEAPDPRDKNGAGNNVYDNFTEERDPDRDSLPVQTTSRIPNADQILELIAGLDDSDPRNRRRAVWKLAQISDSRAMQPLVESMIDGDSYERSLILEALAQICTRSLRPMNQALAISLQDKNPQVRKNAIRDLTRLYDIMSQITQLICHAIDDPDEEVQETAKWAIRQLNLQLPPRLEISPLEATGEAEVDDVQETSYTESTEVQT